MKAMDRRQLLKYLGAATAASHLASDRSLADSALASPTAEASGAGIFLNQVGYLPNGSKQATVRVVDAATRDFVVRSMTDSAVVFKGELGPVMADAASGDQTVAADFSSLRTPGKYQIELADSSGKLSSDPIIVAPDAYQSALRLTMCAFYGQRCGCAVDLGDGYKHPLCHADSAYHASSGKSGALPNHGGWHDAGDYGRYVVNSGISTGSLLWAWELYPAALRGLSLAIPESGGKTPDYLSEVRWNLEWMLQMQDSDGGVWHKQTSERFCAFIMPQDDKLTSYVIGTGAAPYKSTGATADLASVMAIAARCYGPYDAAFAQRCLQSARQAWSWAVAHPNVQFENPAGVSTGGYGDRQLSDELGWASAELWRTTGEAQFEKAFLAGRASGDGGFSLAAPGWGDVTSMACWTYLLAERKGDPAIRARIKDATAAAASTLIERSRKNGYGNTMELREYGWGSNSVAGNQSLLLLIANHLRPDTAARETALNNLHYLLGRNCLGVSWVTQLGIRPFQHPHHRPSVADGIDAPWPGLLSGGPNAHGGDKVADAMPKAPPMRMWIDDQRAYSMNEIAINWNAPLVFLLAGANS